MGQLQEEEIETWFVQLGRKKRTKILLQLFNSKAKYVEVLLSKVFKLHVGASFKTLLIIPENQFNKLNLKLIK